MKKIAGLVLFAIAGILGIGLGARWISRSRSVPHPRWLDWLLENPSLEAVAASKGLDHTPNLAEPDHAQAGKVSVAGLSGLQSTLLLPLYWRAMETRRPDAMVHDPLAVELVQRIDFDFTRFSHLGSSQQVFTMMRTREIDRWVRRFLAVHPDAAVVDIGCGLDARFERVDNGLVVWYDLDLPDVIALRRQVYAETSRRHFIASSAFDLAWLDQVACKPNQPCLFVSEGVLIYFSEAEVRRLVIALWERLPGAELIFDSMPWVLQYAGWLHPTLHLLKQQVGWGLRKGNDLEVWNPDIHLLQDWSYFDLPEPRLGVMRLTRFLPIFGSGYRVVHYRLGEENHVQNREGRLGVHRAGDAGLVGGAGGNRVGLWEGVAAQSRALRPVQPGRSRFDRRRLGSPPGGPAQLGRAVFLRPEAA